MDVTQLVQEETGVELVGVVEKNGPAEGEPRHVRDAQCPSADFERKSSGAKARFPQLRILIRQRLGKLDARSRD